MLSLSLSLSLSLAVAVSTAAEGARRLCVLHETAIGQAIERTDAALLQVAVGAVAVHGLDEGDDRTRGHRGGAPQLRLG